MTDGPTPNPGEVFKPPSRRPQRVPAKVFARLRDDELVVIMHPGVGMGGAQWEVPIDLVPPMLRTPNSLLWIDVDENLKITAITERRE